MVEALRRLLPTVLAVTSAGLAGPFGHHNALPMARQGALPLMATLRGEAALSLCMINVAYRLQAPRRPRAPDSSILDLQADYRSSKDVEETIPRLPEKPAPVLLRQILHKVAGWGRIHASQPSCSFS